MERTKSSKQVYDYILDGILSGKWKRGMQIPSENELVATLEVGRVSVREAYEKLVTLGFLEKRQGLGTFVSQTSTSAYYNSLLPMVLMEFSKDTALEVLEFRLLLDVNSARLCALKGEQKDFDNIENCLKKMEENADNPDLLADYDIAFHTAITYGAKNSLITKVHEILYEILKLHQKHGAYFGAEPHVAISYHQKILAAIRDRDSELAALFMKRHLQYSITRISKQKI